MKKSFQSRIFALLILCVLSLSVFSLPVLADDTELPEGFVSYTLPFGYDIARSDFVVYEYGYNIFEADNHLKVNQETGIIWWDYIASDSGREIVYGTPENIDNVKRFVQDNRAYGTVVVADRIESLYFEALFEPAFLDKLPAGKPTETISASALELYREVLITDSSYTVYRAVGGIYALDDGYAYLDYESLDNSHFNADGSFSYRSGEVTLYWLDEAILEEIYQAEAEGENRYYAFIGEEKEDETETVIGSALFIAFFIFFGVVVPLVPLILGFVFAGNRNRKNNPHARRWLILSALSLGWILLALALFLIIVLA